MNIASRLIRSFAPDNYTLSINLLREARVFEGTVTITGASLVSQPEIRLHAKDLTITSATVDGKEATFSHHENDELAIHHQDITAGPHVVVIAFSGEITDPMHGLYPCYYEQDGVKKELLATQFESHYAREAFPCIDEPEAKATFDLTLSTEQDVVALSNMPSTRQVTENNMLVTTFAQTPRMSTYLLAWVVGELHSVEAKTNTGVDVRVWATPVQPVESLTFALDIAVRTIEFFDDYFGVPYPLPKSDHIALPDFSSGAMENWGLITYREVALLAHPETTSLPSKQYVATVVAHELSHQWFGNLVTMKWWNDLWLNESFANMMEYVAIDAIEPTWNVWLDFESHEVISALRRDSLDGVQSIQTDVSHPDEINTIFDPSIVYAKGGRLLRMLQTYIGDEAMRVGLQDYFKKHQYQNTEAADLWFCLSVASGNDIGSFMSQWMTQPGFPVVHATEKDGQVTLTQERFFIGPHQPSESLWTIPLNTTCSEAPTQLSERSVTFARTHTSPLILNEGNAAHFITHYDEALFDRIQAVLPSLSAVERLRILHEQTLLAQGGVISSSAILPLIELYKDESNEAVWSIIALAIGELKKFVLPDSAEEDILRAYAGRIVAQQYTRLGWESIEGESDADAKLRATVIGLIIYSRNVQAIETALSLYDSKEIMALDPELREIILSVAVRYGEPTVFATLVDTYKNTHDSELRDDIASALTSTIDADTISRLSTLIQDSTFVRSQDFAHWFVWLLRNRHAKSFMWQWTRNNWPWIVEEFGTDTHFDTYPRYIASSLETQEQLNEYGEFFAPMLENISLKRNITIGLTELEGRVNLLERDGPVVRHALLNLEK